MLRNSRNLRSLLLATVVLSAHNPIWAWGNTGHEAVAFVAWKHMDEDTRNKVYALLQQVPSVQSTDGTVTIPGFREWSSDLPPELTADQQHMYVFMRAATWPDSIKHHFFHDSDIAPQDLTEAESNVGFSDRNSHGYWHFIDTPLGTAQTDHAAPALPRNCQTQVPIPARTLPDAPAANVVVEISLLSAALASSEDSALKAYDLVWLENLVGDVHQPLHASNRFVEGVPDMGGNCVAIFVPKELLSRFSSSKYGDRTLHSLWDNLPGDGSPSDTKLAVDYGFTLSEPPPSLAAITDPTIWAKESLSVADQDAYDDPIGAGFGNPHPYVITPAYYAKAFLDVQQRIALAGVRLATLLTQALTLGRSAQYSEIPDHIKLSSYVDRGRASGRHSVPERFHFSAEQIGLLTSSAGSIAELTKMVSLRGPATLRNTKPNREYLTQTLSLADSELSKAEAAFDDDLGERGRIPYFFEDLHAQYEELQSSILSLEDSALLSPRSTVDFLEVKLELQEQRTSKGAISPTLMQQVFEAVERHVFSPLVSARFGQSRFRCQICKRATRRFY